MNAAAKEAFIREHARRRKIKWSSHALAEITPEHLSVDEVEHALEDAIVIEDYPHAHRFLPDCLVLTFSGQQPIHVVVALNAPQDYILIVTVYRPNQEEWQDDWRTRK